ncbi:hypothetical protein CBR_g54110 [Chara braunii]|uniref:Uncharacterized protein n=1 Tax=Chara braunii TaxID=69332 RepID=A0A388MBY4_CHABU|nr:hypothetical protein CBR_g54110 [Chara braunii]|eukprot:GBG92015.1 hypothetical protein CBR_g54110 [Chara braunii]
MMGSIKVSNKVILSNVLKECQLEEASEAFASSRAGIKGGKTGKLPPVQGQKEEDGTGVGGVGALLPGPGSATDATSFPGSPSAVTSQAMHDRQRAERVEAQRQLLRKKHEEEFENVQREVKRRLEAKKVRRDAEFGMMMAEILSGMRDDGTGFVQSMRALVESADKREARRRKSVHASWQKDVFDYIQNQVEKKLQRITRNGLKDRHRMIYGKFLKAIKERTAIFRDIVAKDIYDPFESHQYIIRYSTKGVKDPTLSAVARRIQELQQLGVKATMPPAHTRYTLDPTKWSGPVIQSSAIGHMNADDGSVINVSKGNPLRYKSLIRPLLDHYKISPPDKYRPQKRMFAIRRGHVARPRGIRIINDMER